jgi:gluconokinase
MIPANVWISVLSPKMVALSNSLPQATALHLVVMGVSGCGKSSLGEAVATALGLPLVEGDDFHPPANKAKMSAGLPLADADRAGWLDALAAELAARPAGAVLTCSALKRSYRDRLRAGVPALRFAFIDINRATADERVRTRGGHFFSPALVASQFEALEPPTGEPGVLRLDGRLPMGPLRDQVVTAFAARPTSTPEIR